MPEMKNSHVFYMAPYNSTWRISKIGYECTKLWRDFETDDAPLLCTNKGKVMIRPEEMAGTMVSDDNAMQGIHIGDIAIHGMDTWHGAIALSEFNGKITRVVHVCDSSQENRFIVYYLQMLANNGVYKIISNGVRGNTSDFRSWDKVKDIYIALPTINEQIKICDFLDHRCAKIEALSADIQKEIEILEEYKKSVITEAVTKGLNPDVTMKDSGTPWCPKIPVHWEYINPKALFTQRMVRAYPGEKQLTSSQEYGIIYQDEYMELTGTRIVTVMKDFSILKHVEPNDFVISMRSFQGGLEYSERRGCISSAYVMLIPNDKYVYPPFYRWFFKSSKYINAIQSTSNLVRDGQAMRYANFAQVPLFIVPLKEQKEIADYLDSKISELDAIIKAKKEQLNVLAEYKKSVIYEYVTGKKEVPGNAC